jgi:hypothetical protein
LTAPRIQGRTINIGARLGKWKELDDLGEKSVQLVFGKTGLADEGYVTRGGSGQPMQSFVAGVSEIKEWFKDFQIDSLELWISGGIQTGQVLSLFVSAKGEGGMKVTLKPKQ